MTERFTLEDWIVRGYGEIVGVYFKDNQNKELIESDDIVRIANELSEENQDLKSKIQRERAVSTKQHLKWSKEAETKIKELSEENEQLKQFIQELTTKDGKIHLANGYTYKVNTIIKGDFE